MSDREKVRAELAERRRRRKEEEDRRRLGLTRLIASQRTPEFLSRRRRDIRMWADERPYRTSTDRPWELVAAFQAPDDSLREDMHRRRLLRGTAEEWLAAWGVDATNVAALNTPNRYGVTPAAWAARAGRVDVLELIHRAFPDQSPELLFDATYGPSATPPLTFDPDPDPDLLPNHLHAGSVVKPAITDAWHALRLLQGQGTHLGTREPQHCLQGASVAVAPTRP